MSIKPVADTGLTPRVKVTTVLCKDSPSVVNNYPLPLDKIHQKAYCKQTALVTGVSVAAVGDDGHVCIHDLCHY
jgi:hypothetical protein